MPRRAEQTLRKKQESRRYELDRVRVGCTCGLGRPRELRNGPRRLFGRGAAVAGRYIDLRDSGTGGPAMIDRIAHALPLPTLRRFEALERYGWGPR